MGKQQLEHSLPALIQSMLWHFQQAWASWRPWIKQPSSHGSFRNCSNNYCTTCAARVAACTAPAPQLPLMQQSSAGASSTWSVLCCNCVYTSLPYNRQLQFRQPWNADSSGGFGWHTATIQQLIPLLHAHRFRSRQSSPCSPSPASLPTGLHFLPFHLRSCRD